MNEERKLVSVIAPAYNEEENLAELAQRLIRVFDSESAYEFEVILVENGSTDRTFEEALAINASDGRFKVLQLSRNFRMDGGLTAGIASVRGDAAVLMAADLQDPPELIHEFLRMWEKGYEVVYQIVTERKGTGPLRRMNSRLFYWLAGKMTDGRIPRNVSDYRLVDRKVYQAVNLMEERNRFVRGLFAWVGFSSVGVEAERPPRTGGVSGAHTFVVVDLAFKGLFAHSYKPLRLISIFGVVLSGLAFLAIILFTIRFLTSGVPFAGFGTIVCLFLLMFGFLFTMLGIVSEYVGLIYEEVKQRPNFVVRRRVGIDEEASR